MYDSDYDGVVVESDVGSNGRSTKTYIVFDSSQMKSTDTVTYDDDGNEIPQSARFDSSKKDIRYSMPERGDGFSKIKNQYYQEYLEDMPIDEYNKLTVKKPIQVPKDEYRAVTSARTQLYGDAAEEEIPIIDIVNLGEYGVLNTNDYYFIRNASKVDFSIIKHAKTLKGRKNNYDKYGDGIRPEGKGTSRYANNSNAEEGPQGKNNPSNRNNGSSTDQPPVRKDAYKTQFVDEADRRVGISDGTSNFGRGINGNLEKTKYSLPEKPTAEQIGDAYKNGEITREEYDSQSSDVISEKTEYEKLIDELVEILMSSKAENNADLDRNSQFEDISAIAIDGEDGIIDEKSTKVDDQGLTDAQKEEIKRETGWSDEVVDSIRSIEEAKIYINAGLKETIINGKRCLICRDIDLQQRNSKGLTNKELMELGMAPYSRNGERIEFHHIGQNKSGPFAELAKQEHRGRNKDSLLHNKKKISEINRREFDKIRKQHWKKRSQSVD